MRKKRFVAALLCICMIMGTRISVSASNPRSLAEVYGKAPLAELSEEEAISFVIAMGEEIPEEVRYSGERIKKLVGELEENPNRTYAYGSTVLNELVEVVRNAVKKYYGIQDNSGILSMFGLNRGAIKSLVYSTVYSWDETLMTKYNCYSYAIGVPDNNAIELNAYDPGYFSNQKYNAYGSVQDLAELVKDDLNSGDWGYKCVKITTTRPSTTNGWENAIAVRKDTSYSYPETNDYHFAKLTADGWLHKVSYTAVLKFNVLPTNASVWTNEYYNGTYSDWDTTYESDIMFILYKKNHGSSSSTCPDCGN